MSKVDNNAKKRKAKNIKRGLMTNADRREKTLQKWEESDRRKHGKKYKGPSLSIQVEKIIRKQNNHE